MTLVAIGVHESEIAGDVTQRAGGRDMSPRQREPRQRVIKSGPPLEGIQPMTSGTLRRKTSGRVVRVRTLVIVRAMASIACERSSLVLLESRAGMTIQAVERGVPSK